MSQKPRQERGVLDFVGSLAAPFGAVASARIYDFNAQQETARWVIPAMEGAAAATEFHPWCVTVDALGNLFISDWFNNVVRKVTVSGAISTVAGNGTLGYSGDGGPAISAKLAYPCRRSGRSIRAMCTSRIPPIMLIRKVTAAGNISTIAGNDSRGYTGDFGQATAAQLYEADRPGASMPPGIWPCRRLWQSRDPSDQHERGHWHVRRALS